MQLSACYTIFFSTHSLGEEHVHLHADNCVGQNKNNAVIQVHKRIVFDTNINYQLSFTYTIVPVMAYDTGSSQNHQTLLFNCRTHKIFT